MLYRLLLCFLAIGVWPMALNAAEENEEKITISSDPTLTIGEVVKIALSRSPDKGVIQSKEKKAEALMNKASSFFSNTPEISISHQNDSFGSNQGLREWESSIGLPLWLPGQKSASKQKARMSVYEAKAYDDLITWQITGLIRELLWDIKEAQAAISESLQSLEMAKNLDVSIQKRIKAGSLARQSSLMSSKEIMSQKITYLSAQGEYVHAIKRYESITGLSRIPADIEEKDIKLSEDHGNRQYIVPTIELANARVDVMAAAYKEKSREWSSAPKLSIGVRREKSSYLDRNIDSMNVGLSFPLGSGVHTASKRAKAAVALAEAERERELVKREHRLHLHEADHELEICESQLPISQQHYELAKENLRLSQKAFDVGENDLLDLLKVREQYFQSSSQNIKKKIECKRAVARHNQIKGIILP